MKKENVYLITGYVIRHGMEWECSTFGMKRCKLPTGWLVENPSKTEVGYFNNIFFVHDPKHQWQGEEVEVISETINYDQKINVGRASKQIREKRSVKQTYPTTMDDIDDDELPF